MCYNKLYLKKKFRMNSVWQIMFSLVTRNWELLYSSILHLNTIHLAFVVISKVQYIFLVIIDLYSITEGVSRASAISVRD